MFRNTAIVLALAVAAPASAQRVLYSVFDGNVATTAFLDLVLQSLHLISCYTSG